MGAGLTLTTDKNSAGAHVSNIPNTTATSSLPTGGSGSSKLGWPRNAWPTVLTCPSCCVESGARAAAEDGVAEGRSGLHRHALSEEKVLDPRTAYPSRAMPVASSSFQELEERPPVELDGGARYTGQWRGQERHGEGVLEKPDGQRYEGGFAFGRAHGYGIFYAASGNRYEGQWDQDRAHGWGKYMHVDGSTYEGEWYHDEKSGRGKETWADGARYDGEFLHGSKHGLGSYCSSTGVTYEGQFRHDKMDGEGTYRFADGRVYSGQCLHGHMHGYGRMEWPSGSRYEGSYARDMKHGEGTFTWPDGREYRGQWSNGKQDGIGITVDAKGNQVAGEWRNGERIRVHRSMAGTRSQGSVGPSPMHSTTSSIASGPTLGQVGARRSAFGHGPGHHMAGGPGTPASTVALSEDQSSTTFGFHHNAASPGNGINGQRQQPRLPFPQVGKSGPASHASDGQSIES
mmetsp:Transcript_61331/g.146058  ORF Transcript_61331/g.146058 Transcript_61331/m.146058 type:complete len:458 (-) Transcript_61331:61-1434(-)